MNDILTLIPTAIALAISPAAIIEFILVLFTKRRRLNTLAFLLGILLGTAIGVGIGLLGGNAAGDSPETGMAPIMRIVMGALALLLLVVGLRNWSNRKDESEPAVLATIGKLAPMAMFFLALGAPLLNPKNLPLALAAGAQISDLSSPWLYFIGFVLLACSPYLAVGIYSFAGGKGAEAQLDRLRAWLIRRNRLIMAIICIVLGIVIGIKALVG